MTATRDIAWTQIPPTWPAAPAELLGQAKDRALVSLNPGGRYPVAARLADYYDADLDYAGATFAGLAPISPDDVTASDLHAIALLSVDAGPGSTRRLLEPGANRTEVLAALGNVPDTDLLVAGPGTLAAMETLHLAVKSALSAPTVAHPNAWVTAAKLCARKRPELFPVRDREVCGYLGLLNARQNYQVDWHVFRFLIGDQDVIAAIGAAVEQTMDVALEGSRRVRPDVSRLRLLDAALWTYKIALNRTVN